MCRLALSDDFFVFLLLRSKLLLMLQIFFFRDKLKAINDRSVLVNEFFVYVTKKPGWFPTLIKALKYVGLQKFAEDLDPNGKFYRTWLLSFFSNHADMILENDFAQNLRSMLNCHDLPLKLELICTKVH